jgi:hypothetical protein
MANEHIAVADNSYVYLKTFQYLGSLFTNKNFIHGEIICTLKVGNSYYLFSAKNVVSDIRGENKVNVFVNRSLRRIFDLRGMRMGSEEDSTTRNFVVCILHLI